MAKRELSSTLKNLKFMQRAVQREEKGKKEEEVIADRNIPSSSAPKRCVVIMEGDPRPGAIKGRMSFQSFNPSVDKLNEEASNPCQTEASATSSENYRDKVLDRENGSKQNGSETLNSDGFNSDLHGDLKRKQTEGVSEARYPNKSPKNIKGDQESSPNSSRSSHKQPKREKLDWNVLRPPKTQSQKK